MVTPRASGCPGAEKERPGYFFLFLVAAPAAARPRPTRRRVVGSGTGVSLPGPVPTDPEGPVPPSPLGLGGTRAAGGCSWETRSLPPGPGPSLGLLKLESSGGDCWGEEAVTWEEPPPLEHPPAKGSAARAKIPNPKAIPFISIPPFCVEPRLLLF